MVQPTRVISRPRTIPRQKRRIDHQDLFCGLCRHGFRLVAVQCCLPEHGSLRSRIMLNAVADQPECWPTLQLDSWQDTYATLHMWTQMVGKVRLRLTPLLNHWWNVPFYVTARGLTTSRIPYAQTAFELWFDFIRHQLVLETSDGILKTVQLPPRSVADFYEEFMGMLRSAGIEAKIWRMPVEVPNPIS